MVFSKSPMACTKSGVTFVKSNSGWIVIDPLLTVETARAAIGLLFKNLGPAPVVSVIYTHSHVDHFGGVKGVISEEDVRNGKISVIAPKGFMKEVVSENVLAGNSMNRRATYMYGSLLPAGPSGMVDCGLGKAVSVGTVSLIPPTREIETTGTKLNLDGVEIVFQVTPGTEAPAEMNFYFPQLKALCVAENCTHTMHNIMTLRGAQVRDSLSWSQYIDETIQMFVENSSDGGPEVVFASHHWPTWGKQEIVSYLTKQRDLYKYIHDQSVRLMNMGYTPNELAEEIRLPEGLKNSWSCRNFYGTLSHNSKSIYQRYLGWFDGNPAHLHVLPPVQASKNYVEMMGGPLVVLEKARAYFEKGSYRWVAQVLDHLIFADPLNEEARELQAKTFEQLGFQAESGPWRNFYLTGAMELRNYGNLRSPATNKKGPSVDLISALDPPTLFSILAVRVDGTKAEGKKIKFTISFSDIGEKYLLILENSVLNFWKDKTTIPVDVSLEIPKTIWISLMMKTTTIVEELRRGTVKITGNLNKLLEFFNLLTEFDPWFNIVTPNPFSSKL
eukprot:TRINITY_DN3065_c0_g2_i19.p1 TRINITY_DN3065_c0_g2~~TRINITY_DN3065_c0_g2_i19.p1  ORF type:complete len:557 (-),score=110.02 TRINITY_DN3065_c0_g2_i19:225-1895(-)